MSPALAGIFSTIKPPGKPLPEFLFWPLINCYWLRKAKNSGWHQSHTIPIPFISSFINQTCCEYWPYTRSFANHRRRIRHNLYSVFITKWKSIIFLEQIKNILVQEICLFSLTTKHTETCEVSQGSCMWTAQTGPQSGCHPLLWAKTPRMKIIKVSLDRKTFFK